jgi:hypothetical protein
MDDAGRRRRLGAARDRPGARLFRAGGEEGHKVKERIAGGDQAVEPRLFQADGGEIIVALVVRQHRDLGFDLGGDDDYAGAFGFGAGLHLPRERVAGRRGILVHIADIEHRQRRQ